MKFIIIFALIAVYTAFLTKYLEGRKKQIEVRIAQARPETEFYMPSTATAGSAGFDIYSPSEHTLYPGDVCIIPTGFIMEIPAGYHGKIVSRSSLGSKKIRIAAGENIIDADYRGEVFVCICNDSDTKYTIHRGDRVAQILIRENTAVTFIPCDRSEMSSTERGDGGFGSTGR